MKRGHPKGGETRKSKSVGPDYPAENYDNPWNVGIDKVYGSREHKTLAGPTDTPGAMGVGPLHDLESYDSNWEHGTRMVKGTHRKRGGA